MSSNEVGGTVTAQASNAKDPKVIAHQKGERVVELIKSKCGGQFLSVTLELGDAVVQVAREKFLEFINILRVDSELQFDFLSDSTAVDWMDEKEMRFEAVYHLVSLTFGYRLRIKVGIPEEDPTIDSLVSIWPGANFMERETWDMLGINFRGHPDQRRILMYDEFVGHPLRKDYPVQGKQPRIPLRHPEVRNTALDMNRPPLVAINKKKTSEGGAVLQTPAARAGHNGVNH